jgi:translation initiation factor IF-1
MAKEEKIEMDGIVIEAQPNARFKIQIGETINAEGPIIIATLSGKIRVNNIRVLPGDRVKIEVSPYDISKGRIVYRYKENESSSIS